MHKLTKDDFIKKAEAVHGNKYDYSNVEYKNSYTKVCIICPEHGKFWQLPSNHINGQNCPKCSKRHRPTTNEWIERAIKVHGNKYDYTKVEYNGNRVKVCIICPEHGEFYQHPSDHINGCGCPTCKGVKHSNKNEFIEKAKKIFPQYDYTKVEYVNNKTKVCIVCPEHGEFYTRPNDLLSGYGCRKCAGNILKTNDDFISQCKQIHEGKYDYSLCDYIGANKKVKIICHEKDKNGNEHGVFEQIAANHLNGCGCPRCNSGKKSKMEENVGLSLYKLGVTIERQKTFDWLKYEKNLFLDFYLPEYNIAIEVQGDQHYLPIEKFGGMNDYIIRLKRDEIKRKLCKEHNIGIFYVTKSNYKTDDLVNKINECKAAVKKTN